MIRSKSGLLAFCGSQEMCIESIAQILKISVNDLLERLETPTERQKNLELLKHS